MLGIALGGGSARGWAHIGVLTALEERGISPDIVCGTSIGALVGGAYVSGRLGELAEWVGRLSRRDVFGLVDFAVGGGGAIRGQRLIEFYRSRLGDVAIEDLPRRFAAVATDLRTGAEVWLQSGSLLNAVRASISIPGLFTPVFIEGRWLVDGGLVNPVPVTLCRALGADVVLGVDLHADALISRARPVTEVQPAVMKDPRWYHRLARLFPWSSSPAEEQATSPPAGSSAAEPAPPRFGQVVMASLDIMQNRISRSRLAGDPPDLLLAPRVGRVDPFEFAGGLPTIEEGYDCVQRMLPAIEHLLGAGR